jgi:hypothetical protein
MEAMAQHGRASFESYRTLVNAWMNVGPATTNPPPVSERLEPYIPAEAAIASQQKAYRAKMREVAEQQPEFVEALIRYSEAKARYEEAIGVLKE